MAAPKKRGFGNIRQLPSKRHQARYDGPDGLTHTAPSTFETRMDAEAWLTDRRREIAAGSWLPGGPIKATYRKLGDYAEGWLAARTLKPRTRAHYRNLLDRQILPTFGDVAAKQITADRVRDWHTAMGTGTPTLRAHAYSLLRSILRDAVADGLIPANPCHIRGAGNSKRVHQIKPATLSELTELVDAMPQRYKMMTLLASWCGLRFGELTELRRSDIDQANGVIHVRRGVVRVGGAVLVGVRARYRNL
jgi:integrase